MASSADLNTLNDRLRQSPEYAEWMTGEGIDPSRPIKLTDFQRRRFRDFLNTRGWQIPKGGEIDPAGNLNEKEGVGKQLKKWGPLAAGAAITAVGVPGLFPGLLTGGGTAATAARAVAGGGGTAGRWGGGWLQTALFAGLPAATQLFGAKLQTGATDRAAEIQARSAREALEEIRRQYDLDRAREDERYQADVTAFAPYNQVGQRLVTRAGDLLGNYTPQAYTPVPIRDRVGSGGAMSMAALGPGRPPMRDPRIGPPGSMADLLRPDPTALTTRPMPRENMASLTEPIQMVMLEAPTGERQAVPAHQAEGFIRRGARRIG